MSSSTPATVRLAKLRPSQWRLRASRSPAASDATAAQATLRAAALLKGGIAATRVWRVLGEESDAAPELARVADQIAAGKPAAQALASIDGGEWRVLAAAWYLAEYSGAPFAIVLERLAAALVQLTRIRERRSVLLAGPKATISLVAALPLVSLLLGAALGFDPVPIVLSPVGAILATIGGTLLLGGVRWARTLISRLAATEWVSGLECELCWIALSGGAAQHEALRRVVDTVDRFHVDWVRFAQLRRDGAPYRVLHAAAALGTPAGPILLAEASALRSRAMAELERAAERLAVHLLLPIGSCVLPAFIVLGVLPVLFAVMGSLAPLSR